MLFLTASNLNPVRKSPCVIELLIPAPTDQEPTPLFCPKELMKTIGLVDRKLREEFGVAELNNSASSNNILGLATFDVDGEFIISDVSHMTFLDKTIQGDPTVSAGMMGEAQSSIFGAKDRGMTSLVFMRKGFDQIMTTHSDTFQQMSNDTDVPIIFIDAQPSPYRPSQRETGSTYLWQPNKELRFKDE